MPGYLVRQASGGVHPPDSGGGGSPSSEAEGRQRERFTGDQVAEGSRPGEPPGRGGAARPGWLSC